MKRLMIVALPLMAASAMPAPASAEQAATIVATAAGVVIGGVLASTIVAGTTATIVGSAIGGGIACWWYDGDTLGIEALPRKSAMRTGPAADAAPEVVLISASELRVVPAKR